MKIIKNSLILSVTVAMAGISSMAIAKDSQIMNLPEMEKKISNNTAPTKVSHVINPSKMEKKISNNTAPTKVSHVINPSKMDKDVSGTPSAKVQHIIKSPKTEKRDEVVRRPSKEWYISSRVTVYDAANEKTYTATNPAVFGRLADSEDGFDKNEVRTFDSVVNRKAAAVFVHTDWGSLSGEFHGDYHDTKGGKENWRMTVFSSVPNGEVTLTWDGLYVLTPKEDGSGYDAKKTLDNRVLRKMHLIDTKTGEVINIVDDGILNTYTFTMDSDGEREFVWAFGKGSRSYKASKDVEKYIKAKRKEEQTKEKSMVRTISGHPRFGLPPM